MKAPPAREGGFFVAVEPLAKKGRLQHMAQGTVSRFNEQKGYGFISPDYGGGDVFVHYYVGSARDRL